MSTSRPLRIGTRASRLARWQAEWVRDQLTPRAAGRSIELVEIGTTGDRFGSQRIDQLGTVGVFTKQIQQALLDDQIDVTVHSLKDLPTQSPDGVILAAVPRRGPALDVLLTRAGSGLEARAPRDSERSVLDRLTAGVRVGTGSVRRRAQLLHRRSDLSMCDIRGNVETRVAKLDRGDYDVLVLAEAELDRLGLRARISQILSPPLVLPAAGQGALGLECRAEDEPTRVLLEGLTDAASERAVRAERTVLAVLRAGCHAPVGVLGTVNGDRLMLQAVVLSADGRQRLESRSEGSPTDPVAVGQRVADELLARGAAPMIAAVG